MSNISLLEQIKAYDKDYCFQYQRRLDTYEEDKEKYGWSDEDIKKIKLSDFNYMPLTSDKEKSDEKSSNF